MVSWAAGAGATYWRRRRWWRRRWRTRSTSASCRTPCSWPPAPPPSPRAAPAAAASVSAHFTWWHVTQRYTWHVTWCTLALSSRVEQRRDTGDSGHGPDTRLSAAVWVWVVQCTNVSDAWLTMVLRVFVCVFTFSLASTVTDSRLLLSSSHKSVGVRQLVRIMQFLILTLIN